MKKARRFLVFLTPLGIFFLLEYLLFFYQRFPRSIVWILGLSCLIAVASFFLLAGKGAYREALLLGISPFLLIVSQFLFVLFLESKWLMQLLAVALLIFLVVFLENMYLRFSKSPSYQEYAVVNISHFLNIYTLFSFSAALFGFIVFLRFDVWAAASILMICGFLLTYENFWVISPKLSSSWVFIIVISLIIGELFWVINFLPSSIYVNAFILSIAYYVMLGLARNSILEILDRRVFLRYGIIGVFVLLIVVLTAKWS